MSPKQWRSLKRSILFNVLPALVPAITPGLLEEWGVAPATAVFVAVLIGSIARVLLPGVGEKREAYSEDVGIR